MSFDWRREFRRQHGHAPGTIVTADHLVKAPATPAPAPTPRRRSGWQTVAVVDLRADQVARRARRLRTAGEVEIRAVNRAELEVVEEDAAPAPMVEVAPGRFVNARSLKKLRQGGDL